MEINEIVREDYTTLATAARVMKWGMSHGSFTAKELREYLSTMHESHKSKAVLTFLRGYGFVTVTEEKFDTGIPAKGNCHCEEEYMLPRGTKISLTEYAKLPTELREIVATISTKTESCKNIIGTRYHYTVIQMVKIKSLKMATKPNTNEKLDLSYIAHGDLKWYSHFKKCLAVSHS
jgi:hypothetical protein